MAPRALYAGIAAVGLVAVAVAVGVTAPRSLRGAKAKAKAEEHVLTIFVRPDVGTRINYCYSYNQTLAEGDPTALTGCGQKAADEFCKYKGHDQATAFEKTDYYNGVTVYLEQMVPSTRPNPDAFASIHCIRKDGQPPPEPNNKWFVRTPYLTLDGMVTRVDYCSAYDATTGYSGCGQAAADLWCKHWSNSTAWRFSKDANVPEPTYLLGRNVTNPNPTRDSFFYITCGKECYDEELC